MASPPITSTPHRADAAPWHRLLWVPVVALVLAWVASQAALHDRLAEAIGDHGLRWSAPTTTFDELVVIDIDDASLQVLAPQLGDWPFRRDTYALLIDFLRDSGARAIVFDIVFGGQRQGDDVLARSITRRPDVVLAASGMKQPIEDSATVGIDIDRLSSAAPPESLVTRWPAMSLPSPPLLAVLDRPGGLGVISTPLDADGVLRRLPLVQQIDTRMLPSLPVAAQLVTLDEADRVFSHTRREVRIGGLRWPVDAQGMVRLRLPDNADAVRVVSFGAVMAAALGAAEDGAAVRAALDGRTVYIGSSAFLGDDVVTPLGPRSGTAVLAMAHGTLARGLVLSPESMPLQSLLIALALVPCALLWWRGRPLLRHDGVAALVCLAVVAVVAAAALLGGSQWVDVVTPLSVLLLGFLLTATAQLRWTMKANRRLEHERAVAEAANQAKSDFLASVSHEIRTPLNAVLGMAEVLSRTELSAEQRRYVDVFRSSGATLCNLINDLLDLSKIEAGKLELEHSVFSLRELLVEQMALLQPLAEARQLTLDWHLDAACDSRIEADRQRLAQAIVNLVGNAIKFTQQGGVTLDVKRDASGLLRVDVTDTGIGIANSKFDVIFQPFTQGEGGVTRSYGGTGLGLSITKSLVELMGGRIRVESRPGLGSTFSFTIDAPVVAELPSPPARPQPAFQPVMADAARAVEPAPVGLPILLVDDNDVNLIVTEALLRDTGYSVELARSGEAALAAFRTGRYSVVMMDVQMPGMDGLAATREIRRIEAEEGRRRTPVVALTANAFETDERRSLDAGCDAHLTKPLSRQRLIDAIVAQAAPPTAAAPTDSTAAPAPADAAPVAAAAVADPVDAASAIAALDGDAVLYHRLLAHARAFLRSWNQDVSTALATTDSVAALRLAHDLQAIAERIGAQPLADAAASLDAALRFGDVGGVQRARATVAQRVQEVLMSPSLADP